MAEYNGLKLTMAGRVLLGKALAGAALHFTRVGVGDGTLPVGTSPGSLTGLVHPVRDLPITACQATGAGQAEITCLLSNEGVTHGYWVRELGLFALDPHAGEVLYAYTNAGDLADYLPASGGADLVHLLLVIATVVDQATNVTATVNGSLAFATQQDLRVALEDLFAPSGAIGGFWTHQPGDGNKLRKVSLADAQQAILGNCPTALADLGSRADHLERLVSSQALVLEASNLFPDYDAFMAEDFSDPDQIDRTVATVLSATIGSTVLTVASASNLIIGLNYILTDGTSAEEVRIRDLVTGVSSQVLLETPVTRQYLAGRARLYRSTAWIHDGQAQGASSTLTQSWVPDITWQGTAADIPVTRDLVTTQGNAGAFDHAGDIAFAGEFVTLAQ